MVEDVDDGCCGDVAETWLREKSGLLLTARCCGNRRLPPARIHPENAGLRDDMLIECVIDHWPYLWAS